MRTLHADRIGRWAPALLLAAAGALYLLTLDNGLRPGELLGGDLITHQYAQVQGRPSNAPGYPLYTMGGWLWFRLGRLLLGPESNPIPILSSYSTLWALVALWLLYRLICEVTDPTLEHQGAQPAPPGPENGSPSTGLSGPQIQTPAAGNWPLALALCGFYAVTYFFWYYAVTTEQYTSAVAWTLAIVLFAFRWQRTRQERYLAGIALLAGVGLAHMLTLLIILPLLVWFLWRSEPQPLRRPRLLLAAAGLALLPLAGYIYVYMAGLTHPEWRGAGEWASNWDWFWSFVSTRQGQEELTWSLTPLLSPTFPRLLWEELTPVGLALGLAGIAALGRRRALLLYAIIGVYLAFCFVDRFGNWYQVVMPAYALLVVGMAAGLDRLWRRGGAVGRGALLGGVVALLLMRALASYPMADSHNRTGDTALDPAWAILADGPPAGTSVLGTVEEAAALDYVTGIWGVRPDVRAVTSDQARSLLEAGSASGAGRLAVTAAALPLVEQEVGGNPHYSALGPALVLVSAQPLTSWPKPSNAPEGLQWRPSGHDYGSSIRLEGVWVSQDHGRVVVTLVWRALLTPAGDWSVSVRLLQDGKEVAQQDSASPVMGAYPTRRWTDGEVVGDAYTFDRAGGSEPEGLRVILYRQTENSFENLGSADLPLLP